MVVIDVRERSPAATPRLEPELSPVTDANSIEPPRPLPARCLSVVFVQFENLRCVTLVKAYRGSLYRSVQYSTCILQQFFFPLT